jgi:uncharacterized membrane protein
MQQILVGPGVTTAAPAITDSTRANVVLVAVGLIVLVGLVSVVIQRFISQSQTRRPSGTRQDSANPVESTMTRPVLAVLLVGTVLVLAAASLTFDDAEARNLLVGGVVSLSSAAVAFYFASSGATEARRDLLAATGATVEVPNLVGRTLADAYKIMSAHNLTLTPSDPPPGPTDVVSTQTPAAGTTVKTGRAVAVTFKAAT